MVALIAPWNYPLLKAIWKVAGRQVLQGAAPTFKQAYQLISDRVAGRGYEDNPVRARNLLSRCSL